jgi:hypothetical protein
MLDASVNRVLHTPTTRLRDAAADQSLDGPAFAELASALERLFALGEGEVEEPLESLGDAARPSDPAAGAPAEPAPSRAAVAKVGSR